jgi:hypothetical protein
MDDDERFWLTETLAHELLRYAARSFGARKSRLFACACARQVLPLITGIDAIGLLDVAERVADNGLSGDPDWEASASLASAHRAQCGAGADYLVAMVLEAALYYAPHDAAEEALGCWGLLQMESQGFVDADFEVALVRDIFGNPFRPVDFAPWRTDTAVSLARQMYVSRDFSAMPILADALQEAGCDNDDVLNHCREAHVTHVRGCWVVDGVLGKE